MGYKQRIREWDKQNSAGARKRRDAAIRARQRWFRSKVCELQIEHPTWTQEQLRAEARRIERTHP